MGLQSSAARGFGRAWFALTVAFALHVLDEAVTGFLAVYNAASFHRLGVARSAPVANGGKNFPIAKRRLTGHNRWP